MGIAMARAALEHDGPSAATVAKRHGGWACRGSQKLEQETPRGAHMHKK